MSTTFNRDWLTKKFIEIQRRISLALDQLSDDQVNWRPNPASHNISGLIRHIEGNIEERIVGGILQRSVVRDRNSEFNSPYLTTAELRSIIQSQFQFVVTTITEMTDEQFHHTQFVRGKERSHLDMLHQCAAHYSEHIGQILYIAKQCLQEKYQTTSI
jgi:hypothetical protein